jgi:glucose-6-phosphate dehydrogenase assembly protein OpcA
MPAILDTSRLGEPVAIGQIGRELKKLWDTGDSAPTRASLMNFAVYCRSLEALAENTELIAQFTRHHACRALLICVLRDAPEPRASAWINAHCHLSRAGAKQVCCEQISFLLEGEIKGRLTNIVFSNLDSDLPLYFWWQGDLSENLNPHLWSWIDRLIVDSCCWNNPQAQFTRLRASLAATQARLTLRDLNWTRSLYCRQALSQIFDHPENLPHLRDLKHVAITSAPGNRSTALLLLGWLATQLGWTLKSTTPILLADHQGREIPAVLRTAPGDTIAALTLTCSDASFNLHRDPGSHYLHAELNLPGGHQYHHLFPAGPETIVDLLDEEMSRASTDRIYLRVLTFIEPLL